MFSQLYSRYVYILFIVPLLVSFGCTHEGQLHSLTNRQVQIKSQIREVKKEIQQLAKLEAKLSQAKVSIEKKIASSATTLSKHSRNILNNIADINYKQEEFAVEIGIIKEMLTENRQLTTRLSSQIQKREKVILKELKQIKLRQLKQTPPYNKRGPRNNVGK